MRTIQVQSRVGPDGVLHIDIPIGPASANSDVVVTIEPKPNNPTQPAQGWPPGFFERTAGSIDDNTFFRHPQGEFEKRLDLE